MVSVKYDITPLTIASWYCPFCHTMNMVGDKLEPCIGCKAVPHFVAEKEL